jgi:biopolymer transport protein ExbD
MLDVVFILLIFFAVSTTLVMNNKGIKLQLPAAESVVKQKKGVVVSIDKKERVFLNNVLVPEELLKSKISDLITSNPDTQVILNAHVTTPYQKVIRVLDDIRLGGGYDIVLQAEKKINNEDKRKGR